MKGGKAMIRKTYIRKVEARLAQLEEDIDRLRNRLASPVGEIKDRIDREFADLRTKADVVRKGIRAVESSGETQWGRLKKTVDEGMKELGHALAQALEKVRKTGAGG